MVVTEGPDLRAVVIGCGRMGALTRDSVRQSAPPGWIPLAHAEAIRGTPGFVLTALCDPDPSALAAAGRRHRCDRLYREAAEMLAGEQPDVVTIATRTPGRADLLVRAAGAGVRGIHAEKPLCNSVAEGLRAAAALTARRVVFSYGALRRYMPVYRRALEIARSGAIGDPVQILVAFGPGRLMWTHPHSVDLMMFFAGARAVSVRASLDVREGAAAGTMIDDDPLVRSAHVEFENGMCGTITLAGGSDITIAGTRGNVRVVADGAALIVEREGALGGAGYFLHMSTEQPRPSASGLQTALSEMRATILGAAPAGTTVEEAVAGQRILFAMALSSLEGGGAVDPAAIPHEFIVTGRSGQLPA